MAKFVIKKEGGKWLLKYPGLLLSTSSHAGAVEAMSSPFMAHMIAGHSIGFDSNGSYCIDCSTETRVEV